MRKNFAENRGIPLFVNPKADLPAREGAAIDSWYVISNFESEGEQLGFMWHQQIIDAGPAGRFLTAEFLLMNGNRNIWSNNSIGVPVSLAAGADRERLNVYSPLGALTGDAGRMELKLHVDEGALDVVLTPKKEVLCNGTTGLLKFMGGIDSYQFSFPNMDIEGSFTLRGKTCRIEKTTAWFDRQWGFEGNPNTVGGTGMNKPAWLWLGMTLNEDSRRAISLWDCYGKDGRFAFATVLNANGTQVNAAAEVTYDRIWTSEKSGNSYPYEVHIAVPSEDLQMNLTAVIDKPEFSREGNDIAGCQSFCRVAASYQGNPIDRYVILEMVGDLCGEA